MLLGLAIIFVGFILTSLDSDPHGYGFLGLTLGPVVALGGFLFEIYAIMHKPEEK